MFIFSFLSSTNLLVKVLRFQYSLDGRHYGEQNQYFLFPNFGFGSSQARTQDFLTGGYKVLKSPSQPNAARGSGGAL